MALIAIDFKINAAKNLSDTKILKIPSKLNSNENSHFW